MIITKLDAVQILYYAVVECCGAETSSGERTDPDQELLAFGMANLGAGLSGGYAITGTMSKTEVALMSGGKSQIEEPLGVSSMKMTLPSGANAVGNCVNSRSRRRSGGPLVPNLF